ncbi:MAG TPA: hypothetical protein VGS23_09350 [Thermoplasmata archaeon]|nr:hypothetical protein [Thermoplasmata archaeon]
MAIFSDIDWAILLIAAAFLLFGKENQALLRTLGRYYGRAMRLKQELLAEFTQAAGVPSPANGAPVSLREALFRDEVLPPTASHAPLAVTHAPTLSVPPSGSAWTGALGPQSWSMALPPVGLEPRGGR